MTFLDLHFLVVLKTYTKKVLAAGTFKGCSGTFGGCSDTFGRFVVHPVESILLASLGAFTILRIRRDIVTY